MRKGTVYERMNYLTLTDKESKWKFIKEAFINLSLAGGVIATFIHVLLTETLFAINNIGMLLIMFSLFLISVVGFMLEKTTIDVAFKNKKYFFERELELLKKYRKGVVKLLNTVMFGIPISIILMSLTDFYQTEVFGYQASTLLFGSIVLLTFVLIMQCIYLTAKLGEIGEESDLPYVKSTHELFLQVDKINKVISHRNQYFPESDFENLRKDIKELNALIVVYKKSDEIVKYETRGILIDAMEKVYYALLENTELKEEIDHIIRKANRIME